MSNKALNYVWQCSQQSGGALVVLLAIADMANDDGDCWPGTTSLASKCRMGERNLQKITAHLKKVGELLIFLNDGAETGQGKTNRYRIPIPAEGANASSPPPLARGEPQYTPGVNPSTPLEAEGVNASTPPGVNPSTPDPSLRTLIKDDPSVEPSDSRARAQESDSVSVAEAAAAPPTIEEKTVQQEAADLMAQARQIATQKTAEHDPPPRPNIFTLYENNIGLIASIMADKLKQAEQDYPADWIAAAFEDAVTHNARNWAYIEAILKRRQAGGKDVRTNPNTGSSARTGAPTRQPYEYTPPYQRPPESDPHHPGYAAWRDAFDKEQAARQR